jgi:hypothetical protein
MPQPSYSSWYDHPNDISWDTHIMKLP